MEKQRETKKYTYKPNSFNPSSSTTQNTKPNTSKPEVKREVAAPPKTPFTSNSTRKCYKYQGFGHIASDFWNRNTVTIIEEGPIQFDRDPNEEMEEEVGEVVEFADEGEALVIRRNLSSIQKEE